MGFLFFKCRKETLNITWVLKSADGAENNAIFNVLIIFYIILFYIIIIIYIIIFIVINYHPIADVFLSWGSVKY